MLRRSCDHINIPSAMPAGTPAGISAGISGGMPARMAHQRHTAAGRTRHTASRCCTCLTRSIRRPPGTTTALIAVAAGRPPASMIAAASPTGGGTGPTAPEHPPSTRQSAAHTKAHTKQTPIRRETPGRSPFTVVRRQGLEPRTRGLRASVDRCSPVPARPTSPPSAGFLRISTAWTCRPVHPEPDPSIAAEHPGSTPVRERLPPGTSSAFA
jgi:hypothetical protein